VPARVDQNMTGARPQNEATTIQNIPPIPL
jgi:hypothetical protein